MAQGELELAVQIAVTAEEATKGLAADRALLYSDLIRISLGEAARRAFEDLMATGNYQFQSDYHRKLAAIAQAEVKAEVEAASKAEGEAFAVLKVLATRRIPVSDEQKARVLACTDLDAPRALD